MTQWYVLRFLYFPLILQGITKASNPSPQTGTDKSSKNSLFSLAKGWGEKTGLTMKNLSYSSQTQKNCILSPSTVSADLSKDLFFSLNPPNPCTGEPMLQFPYRLVFEGLTGN